MTRRMQVRDVTEPVEAICRQFLTDRGIPAIYLHDLTRPLLGEFHALMDRRGAEAYKDGKADAITKVAEG